MNDGWRTTISQLYRKKTVKRNLTSSNAQIPTNSRQNEERVHDESNAINATRNKIVPESKIHSAVSKSSSCECHNCKVEKADDRPLSK